MDVFKAIILGILQGVTEFLPVSSSGHLVLLQKIFDINEPTMFFDTMLHAGTLAAVVVVLWRDIWGILKKIIQPLTGFLITATIPAVIAAVVFKDEIEGFFKSGNFLSFCFLITAAFLITAEILSRRIRNNNGLKKDGDMNWLDALIIGIMQAIAIPPGISRSGATISGALFRKLNRDFAARFSFLLSIPAILGAVVLQSYKLLKSVGATGTAAVEGAAVENIGTLAVIAGAISAAIAGFFAVKFMLKIIKERSLFGFAVYTGVLGILILFDQYVTRIWF
jgi:undecaprenyl-diphosphatase